MFWEELTFKKHDDVMMFCVSFFIFCFEPTVTEKLDENNFHQHYGIFFDSTILKLLDHSYVQSSFATITKYFDNSIWNNALQLKILWTWITIWTNFFLGKYLSTKIYIAAWKIIIYTIILGCSSKNIAPKYLTYYCVLLFLTNSPSL